MQQHQGRQTRAQQGDLGELYAAHWFARNEYRVWIPFGHSPHADFIAEQNGALWKVQVKTSTVFRKGRWEITLSTKGGNRSWNGNPKCIDKRTFDLLFVVVGDWRAWLIPSQAMTAGQCLLLGGPKYETFEVSPLGPASSWPATSRD